MTTHSRWTYTTEHSRGDGRTTIAIQTVPKHVALRPPGPIQSAFRCPPTPRIPCRPLPGYPINCNPHTPDLFPISLSQPGLSSVQTSQLSDLIPAFTTISVCDTSNCVLCSVKTSSVIMTTADFVQFLQHFVCHGLPSYASLSPPVQQSVEVNFVYRHGAHGHDMWNRFVRGIPRFGGPTGLDLILGNTILWLLDVDASGMWIATVDVPRSPYSMWQSHTTASQPLLASRIPL